MQKPSLPLVSVEWLADNLNNPDLVILEASLPKVGATQETKETLKIKDARIFNIETDFSDTSSPLPHTMPSSEAFSQAARKLGVNQNSIIVVYDNLGVYSSPRAWWMFRAMGHESVFVLNGGLPAWKKAGFATGSIDAPIQVAEGNFTAHYQPELISNSDNVLAAIDDKNAVIIDARSAARFSGKAPEPREGLRSGHIPQSVNLPFDRVLDDTEMKDKAALEQIYRDIAGKKQQLIFSCGSGVTACIIALGAEIAGYSHISVYDGSWSEWGRLSELPVEKD